MIMGSSGRYLAETTHDHETPPDALTKMIHGLLSR